MKWLKKKLDGVLHYLLVVTKTLIFQIEPNKDRYIIWVIINGWCHKFMKVKKLETAKLICSEIAAVVEKYKEQDNEY